MLCRQAGVRYANETIEALTDKLPGEEDVEYIKTKPAPHANAIRPERAAPSILHMFKVTRQ